MTQDYVPTSVAQHGSALARTTPEFEQVRDGVWAIPLPLPPVVCSPRAIVTALRECAVAPAQRAKNACVGVQSRFEP